MIKKIVILAVTMCMLQACGQREIDPGLKSPCVAAPTAESVAKAHPCGPRKPVNQWLS